MKAYIIEKQIAKNAENHVKYALVKLVLVVYVSLYVGITQKGMQYLMDNPEKNLEAHKHKEEWAIRYMNDKA